MKKDIIRSTMNLAKLDKGTWKEALLLGLVIIGMIVCPFSLFFCFQFVSQYERAIILRFGLVTTNSPAGPGLIWKTPIDTVLLVDIRTRSINLPSQEILTRDSVTVMVDAVVYFHIKRPLLCYLNVIDYQDATQLLCSSSLRNILGQFSLTEMLSNRAMMSTAARTEINKVVNEWGVEMERVDIKDVILPQDLQKAMAAEAEGTRVAKAKIIEAEGEIKAAENFREASRIMMENPQTILLRYLQTLNFIAAEQKTSILFPFPMELPNL